jgi:hypothetical protein
MVCNCYSELKKHVASTGTPPGRPRHGWESGIAVYFEEIVSEMWTGFISVPMRTAAGSSEEYIDNLSKHKLVRTKLFLWSQ